MRIQATTAEIIYPDIDDEFEILVEPCIEMMLKDYGMYYFSNSFKLNEFIVKNILNKYSYNKKKKSIFKKDESDLYINNGDEKSIDAKVLDEFNKYIKQNDISQKSVLAYYIQDDNLFIIANKNLYFLKTNDAFNINYLQFGEDNKFISENSIGDIFNIVFSKSFIYIIEELKELNKTVDVRKNQNPLKDIPVEYKKIYIKILIYMCFFEEKTTSGQVFRLEQIARQFNICSNEILEMIEYVCNVHREKYIEEVYELKKLLPSKYNKILLIDLITLNILGNKFNKDSINFIKEIENLLNVKYSEIEQVKRELAARLKIM